MSINEISVKAKEYKELQQIYPAAAGRSRRPESGHHRGHGQEEHRADRSSHNPLYGLSEQQGRHRSTQERAARRGQQIYQDHRGPPVQRGVRR